MRQDNVEADRFGADIMGTAIGCLHDGRSATRADDEMPLPCFVGHIGLARELRQSPRLFVKARLFLHPFGNDARTIIRRIGQKGVGLFRLRNAGRSVNDQHRSDIGFIEKHLGLEQFKLEPHRTQILAQQEIGVLKSKPVRLAACLGGGKLLFREIRFLLGFVEAAICYFCIVH